MKRFLTVLLLLCCLLSVSMSRKPKFLITVHSPGDGMESPKSIFRMPVGGSELTLRKTPEFSSVNIAAVHSFPADDGTYGLSMKMDFNGSGALELVTRMRQGEVLVTMLNGVYIDAVTIDQPITDGIFTIWHGIPLEIITEIEKKYPKIKTMKSSSEFLDMTPSTKKEKKRAMELEKEAIKRKAKEEAAAAKKAAKGEEPELPLLYQNAPTSSQIPLEAAPLPLPGTR